MTHKCDDCGQEFKSISRLRLHECPGSQVVDTEGDSPDSQTDAPTESQPEDQRLSRQELKREYPDVVGGLPSLLEDAQDGDVAILSRAIAEYERVLAEVARGDAPENNDIYTDLQFAYYEPLADGLDTAAEANGWDVLIEFTDAYNPHEQDGFPEVGHVIANALGRSIIRTRQNDGVAAIPTDALAFLGAIPEFVDQFHIAFEESYTYGWGIGHPEHSVAEQLYALAEDKGKFVKITMNTAFYVDQHAAIDVFETLITNEASGTYTTLMREVDLTEFYFKSVADLEIEGLVGPHAPPYWGEDDTLPDTIDVDPDVRQRIRELAQETGVADELPDDWSLQDLEEGPVAGMLDMLNAKNDHS